MFRSIWFTFVLLYNSNPCLSQDDFPEVDCPLGKVRGIWKTSLGGRKYAAFEGVPYAKPPVGDLRFEEPQPVTPWSGTWVANSPHSCLQIDLMPTSSSGRGEDCLYLNVYVPSESIDNLKKLDVVVTIHGGAFMIGDGHTMANSNTFMDRDIILVSINYRLGILGFLSTEDGVIPGNNGMKDQVQALKWVKDNIVFFGGNPQSVTLMGLSAGGASVHLHYLSPLSRGLFTRGISQSGTALAPWVIRRNSLRRAKKLATLVSCPDHPTEALKDCLKQIPAHDLLNQQKHFYGYGIMPFSPFAPVVEKESQTAFLTKGPYQILKEGNVFDAPWITSSVIDEGLMPSATYWTHLDDINEKWTTLSPHLLDFNDTLPVSKRQEASEKILERYLGPGEKISEDNFKKFTQIFTDRLFTVSSELSAKMQAQVTRSPVYYYLFNYADGQNKVVNFFSGGNPKVTGIAHGEDAAYFYGSLLAARLSEQDERLRNACLDILYSFVSTGKPSFDGSDIWQPTRSTELTYLNITGPDDMKLQKTRNLTPIDFWNNLGFLENGNVAEKDEL